MSAYRKYVAHGVRLHCNDARRPRRREFRALEMSSKALVRGEEKLVTTQQLFLGCQIDVAVAALEHVDESIVVRGREQVEVGLR